MSKLSKLKNKEGKYLKDLTNKELKELAEKSGIDKIGKKMRNLLNNIRPPKFKPIISLDVVKERNQWERHSETITWMKISFIISIIIFLLMILQLIHNW